MGFDPITTKYCVPQVHEDHVVRERLVDTLEEHAGTRLISVTAPAGFGKTSLVSSWAKQNASRKFAWLSLDDDENSLLQFGLYLIAAIQRVESAFARDLQISLSASQHLDPKTILKELINQLAALDDSRLRIVLDDFHVVDDEQVLALMNGLIEYLPPGVQWVIISRKTLPLDLPRWRVRGWMAEIDANRLRFTLNEADTFLKHTLRSSAAPGIGDLLHRRTEGWAAGLQLVAYSMKAHANESGELPEPWGGAAQYISDYLMAEVFTQQPPRIQEFLLKVSVVRAFNASLAAAIVNIEEDEALSILTELGQSDVLISSIDQEGQWFRCHKLFLEFLEKQRSRRFASEHIQQLHRNAGKWYGEANLVTNAVEHSLHAKAYGQAAYWIEQIPLEDLWQQALGSRFLSWVPRFPESELRKYPQVVLRALGSFVIRNEGDQIQPLLRLIEGNAAVENEYKLFKGFLFRFSAKQAEAIALFKEIHEGTSKDDPYHHFALHQIAISLIEKGALTAADELISDFYEARVRHPITQPIPWLQMIHLFGILKYFQGNLSDAERILKAGFEQLEMIDFQTPLVGLLHNGLGQIYFGWNELDRAETAYTEALRWGNLSGIADIQNGAHLGLFQIRLAQYAPAAEEHLKESYRTISRGDSTSRFQESYAALTALMHLKFGKMDAANDWADSFAFSGRGLPDFGEFGQYLIYAMIRLQQADAGNKPQDLDDLLAVIEYILRETRDINQVASHLSFLLAKTIGLRLQKKNEAAIQAFHQAAEILRSTRLLRVFITWGQPLYAFLMEARMDEAYRAEVRQILLAFSSEPGRQGGAASPVEGEAIPLTQRELEVLTLIALGMSNKEIQNKLVISENTVRSHVRNLYRKLGVNSRTQAVKAGQESGLL